MYSPGTPSHNPITVSQQPPLYKRTRTGAIQVWSVIVMPLMDSTATITKTSGQLGSTKPTVHREVIAQGKNLGRANQTTPLEQARSQAVSDWNRKRDEGYKSLDDLGLGIDAPFEGLETLRELLEEKLPQFNSDASGNAKPMLAKSVDWKKVVYPCLVQPKLDGVRCTMVISPDAVGITFLSRSGKEITTLSHIGNHVEDWLVNHPNLENLSETILDGEIYSDELTFQEIVAAYKKQRVDTVKLRFRAYDMISDGRQDVRIMIAGAVVGAIGSEYVQTVPTVTCFSKEEVIRYHDEWVQAGCEGAMIRFPNGTYDQGQRSSSLLKVKEFDSNEFTCTNLFFGQRGEDLMAACVTKEGKSFNVKMTGTRAHKEELQKEYMDKESRLTVKHFGYTDDNIPRFPVGVAFRDYE